METILNKAKRYDEILVKLQEAKVDNSVCDERYCCVIDDIVPELKEGMDEKIKNTLINFFDGWGDKVWDSGIKYSEVVAWLQKQGEQKPVTDFSDIRTWKYIVDAVWTEKKGIGQYLDSPFTEEVAKKLQKRFGNIEQKPTWSEEDEEKFSFIRAILIDAKSPNNCASDSTYYGEVTESIEWLKSIKGRYTWKPSDEQMKAIRLARSFVTDDYFSDNPTLSEILIELENQLKKLREE